MSMRGSTIGGGARADLLAGLLAGLGEEAVLFAAGKAALFLRALLLLLTGAVAARGAAASWGRAPSSAASALWLVLGMGSACVAAGSACASTHPTAAPVTSACGL